MKLLSGFRNLDIWILLMFIEKTLWTAELEALSTSQLAYSFIGTAAMELGEFPGPKVAVATIDGPIFD